MTRPTATICPALQPAPVPDRALGSRCRPPAVGRPRGHGLTRQAPSGLAEKSAGTPSAMADPRAYPQSGGEESRACSRAHVGPWWSRWGTSLPPAPPKAATTSPPDALVRRSLPPSWPWPTGRPVGGLAGSRFVMTPWCPGRPGGGRRTRPACPSHAGSVRGASGCRRPARRTPAPPGG
jgi:hypothetical protein